jgi:hypothetical protein
MRVLESFHHFLIFAKMELYDTSCRELVSYVSASRVIDSVHDFLMLKKALYRTSVPKECVTRQD